MCIKTTKCNEVQARFCGNKHKQAGTSRNRQPYRNLYYCTKLLKGICIVLSAAILGLNSLSDPSEATQSTKSLLFVTCWCTADKERKYQLSPHSENTYVGRLFPKTSNFEILANAKISQESPTDTSFWMPFFCKRQVAGIISERKNITT